LDDPEGFLNLNKGGPFFLANFTRVAQDDVAVSNRVDFVNSDLLAQLVKLAEKTRQETDDLLWLGVFRELCKADHVCVKKSYVFE